MQEVSFKISILSIRAKTNAKCIAKSRKLSEARL